MWSVYLKDINDNWYLFKAFNDVNRALASEAGFRRSDFDVMLIYSVDNTVTLSVLNSSDGIDLRIYG